MKKIILFSFFFHLGLVHANEADISWSYQRTTFKGPRSLVLKLTDTMTEIYKTKTGEMLIHGLKHKRPEFRVSINDSHLAYQGGGLRELLGNSVSTDAYSLFPILFEVFQEEYGGAFNLSEADFLKELEEAEEETISFAPFPFITVKGSPKKLKRMLNTLHQIKANPLGMKLYEDMQDCQKELLIYDDKHSLSGGGYTGANHASSGIFEGRGENAYIRFRFDQPVEGSHLVGTKSSEREQIPFLYIDNVYHELVHAKHIMCGTMSFSGSEAQAIHEENHFRAFRPETKSWPERDSQKYEEGVQVWFGYHLDLPQFH